MQPLYVRLSREDPLRRCGVAAPPSLMKKARAGIPLKGKYWNWLVRDPAHRIPQAVKAAALGQRMQNRIIGVVPQGPSRSVCITRCFQVKVRNRG